MLDKYIDNSEPTKIRTSLLTISLLTVFFANITFASNELSFLGLEIIIEQPRLVAFGQIASTFLLLTFIIRSLPGAIKGYENIFERRMEKRKSIALHRIQYEYFGDDPAPPSYGPEGETQDVEAEFASARWRLNRLVERLFFVTSLLAMALLDYGLPVGVGVLAARYPYFLSDQIDEMAGRRVRSMVDESNMSQ